MRIKIALVPFLAVFIFTGFFLTSVPNLAHAGPTGGGGCSGVTWEYQYTLVTNPFPPGTPGSAAFQFLYGGDSYTVQSTYQVATVGDTGEGCIEEPTTPTAGIIVVPSSIDTGGSSSLSWSSTYATSCTGTNFSTGGATSGSLIVSPAESTVYTVTCTDGAQTVSSSALLTVNPPPAPTVTLTANPSAITSGASSMLTWTSANAVSCTGTGFETAGNTSGSVSTGSLSATTNYSITCSGASSSTTVEGGTPTSGTWQYSSSDISDFFCSGSQTRVSNLNLAYSNVPNCPVQPNGKSCTSGSTCKINTANDSCQIETDIYQCVGGSSGSTGSTSSTPGLTASAYATVTVAETSQPDLAPTDLTPTVVVAGVQSTFVATLHNSGGAETPPFSSVIYVCPSGDLSCQNNPTVIRGIHNSILDRLGTLFVRIAYAANSLKITLNGNAIPASSNGTQSGTHTFSTPGDYKMRLCADLPLNQVTESNENDNCGTWRALVVCPAGNTIVNGSCSANDSGGDGTGTGTGTGTTPGGPSTTPGTPGTSSLSALLTAFPISIQYGSSSLLSWTSAHATSCTGGNFNTGGATAGTISVTPSVATLYSLTCTDAAGNNAFSTATVTVVAPSLTITGTPQLVRSGSSATISWHANGPVHSCTVSGPSLSSTASSGSQTLVITAESTYTFSCAAGVFSPVVSTTVKVLPAFNEI